MLVIELCRVIRDDPGLLQYPESFTQVPQLKQVTCFAVFGCPDLGINSVFDGLPGDFIT